MVARALAFADVADTGQRPVSVHARLALDLVAVGGRFVQTKRGYALFDENGRYVGLIEDPGSTTAFGPSSPTTLLHR